MKVVRKPGPAADRLAVALKGLDGVRGKVGWHEGAKYDEADGGQPVAYIASIHEFGYPEGGIPARPFMRPTITKQREIWAGLAAQGARAVLKGSMTALSVVDALGQKAAGDIAKTIATIQSPPLSEATVEARQRQYKDKATTGSLTKPLVDTSRMITTISSTVEKIK
jgi:hypothetical protein